MFCEASHRGSLMADTPQHSPPPTLAPAAAYALWAASYPPHAHNPLMLAEERAMLALLPADLRGRKVLDAAAAAGATCSTRCDATRGACWVSIFRRKCWR